MLFRRGILHPSCNPVCDWHYPTTIAEWNKYPSRKLDVLAEILVWHLGADGRQPLKIIEDKLCPDVDFLICPSSGNLPLPSDKIVVYCAFPSCFQQISTVSFSLRRIKNVPNCSLGSQTEQCIDPGAQFKIFANSTSGHSASIQIRGTK